MKVHNIAVRSFCKEEDLAEGRLLFKSLLPEDAAIVEEKLEPESEGDIFTSHLYVLKAVVSKPGRAEKFLKKILSSLSGEDRMELEKTMESRIDDDCNLYLRLGKKALAEGKIELHTRNPIHVKTKLACFPKKKESAVKIARELLLSV